jgi:hypothetical protein
VDPHCFNANPDRVPDPPFYINADTDPEPGSQSMRSHADQDPGQTLLSEKAIMENILYVGSMYRSHFERF